MMEAEFNLTQESSRQKIPFRYLGPKSSRDLTVGTTHGSRQSLFISDKMT
jgi:hypothetical protein